MRKVDPERQQAKRRQIMEAAADCFARRGFHAPTTAEICAAAGMSPGNLFHYFDSKSAIVEAIIEEEQRDTAAYFETLGDAPDLLEALLGFLDVVMGFAADKAYSRLALEIAAEATRNPTVGARVAASDAATREAIAALLRTAVARRQVDASLDAGQTASWIAALIDGVFARLAVDSSFEPEAEAPMLRLIVSRFLRPGRAA